jgi:hypothetical protein
VGAASPKKQTKTAQGAKAVAVSVVVVGVVIAFETSSV